MDAGIVFGLLGFLSVLASSSLYALNHVAPSLSERAVRLHCPLGLASVVFTLLNVILRLDAAGGWGRLSTLGLVLVVAGSGMVLKYIPNAGVYRYHSASLHPAIVVALLVSMLFHMFTELRV
ncbi:hypothetical protein JXL21_09225 [Candidatus Bathyarchaeota archaeon]|nr:hypothetical protein [Candidatus Bathyarchaeota archaeon]